MLANFVTTDNPKNLWIGEIINSGERTYSDWMRRQQSMSYMFKEQSNELLEKQRLMYTRISLSKDPEAIVLKEHLEQSVQLLGFPEGTDMSLLFSGMSTTIDNLKTQLDL